MSKTFTIVSKEAIMKKSAIELENIFMVDVSSYECNDLSDCTFSDVVNSDEDVVFLERHEVKDVKKETKK